MTPRRLVSIPIKKLRCLPGQQHRAEGLEPNVVADYRTVLTDLDEVVVFEMTEAGEIDGQRVKVGDLIVGDGFHTIDANEKEGKAEVRCSLRDGTPEDAEEWSFGANARHGLRRSPADLNKVILDAHRYSERKGKNWSSRDIAEQCKTTHTTVLKALAKMIKRTGEGLETVSNSDGGSGKNGNGSSSPPAPSANHSSDPADDADDDDPAWSPEPPDFARARKDAEEIVEKMEKRPPDDQAEQRQGLREIAARGAENLARARAALGVLTAKDVKVLGALYEDLPAE